MFDTKQLQKRCAMQVENFLALGDTIGQKDWELVYIDNGADILAVANMDISWDGQDHFFVSRRGNGDPVIVHSPRLDGRLGLYLVTDLLPVLGVKSDILLTMRGGLISSGVEFDPAKQYNWMFSFDFAGVGAELYDFWTLDLRDILLAHEIAPYHGGYSDIADMDHMGCSGINFGNGSFDYGSQFAYAWLDITSLMVHKFLGFYKDYGHIYLPHESFDSETDWPTTVDGFDPETDWIMARNSDDGGEFLDWCEGCSGLYSPDELVYDAPSGQILCPECVKLLHGGG